MLIKNNTRQEYKLLTGAYVWVTCCRLVAAAAEEAEQVKEQVDEVKVKAQSAESGNL